MVAELADEDLVGQVLMPYAYGSDATRVDAASAARQPDAGRRGHARPRWSTKYKLGGLILVGFTADDPTGGDQPDDQRARARSRSAQLTAGLQQAAAANCPAARRC